MARMIKMWRSLTVVMLTAVTTVALGCTRNTAVPVGRVVALEAMVETEPTGSVLVRETYTLAPDPAGVIQFERAVAAHRSDGVEFVSAEVDGTRLEPDADGLTILKNATPYLVVRWRVQASNVDPRRLTLTLRAKAAVAVTSPRAGLEWPLLSRGHRLAAERVDVALTLPRDTPVYPGTGMLEGGWQVARTDTGITARKAPVGADESATLVAAFDFDRSEVSDPIWERNLDRQREFLPALVAAAIFFVIVGAGTLIILRAQYPSHRRLAAAGQSRPSPAERDAVARGLTVAGITGAGVAVLSSVLAATMLTSLGIWVHVIPASMLMMSLIFVLYAPRLRK